MDTRNIERLANTLPAFRVGSFGRGWAICHLTHRTKRGSTITFTSLRFFCEVLIYLFGSSQPIQQQQELLRGLTHYHRFLVFIKLDNRKNMLGTRAGCRLQAKNYSTRTQLQLKTYKTKQQCSSTKLNTTNLWHPDGQ